MLVVLVSLAIGKNGWLDLKLKVYLLVFFFEICNNVLKPFRRHFVFDDILPILPMYHEGTMRLVFVIFSA